MFNPISIAYLNEELNKTDWVDRIYRLDSSYVFKFNISKLISSSLSQMFYSFIRSCLQLVTMKTYFPLLDSKDMPVWHQQLDKVSHKIKSQYCVLINHIKKDKKVYVMDIMIFVIALLSRDFLGNFFDKTRKKLINPDKKTNLENKGQKGMLQVEQYTFIIITYETTGNIVSPHAFQILKKRLSEHKNFPSRHESLEIIVSSLRNIRDQYDKKMTIIRSLNKYSTFEESIESVLKILDNFEYYQEKLQRKSNKREDKISSQLSQILDKNFCKQTMEEHLIFTKLQKVSQLSLSKAAKVNYKIIQKDLSLLQRTKRKIDSLSLKKSRKSYWRQIKHVNQPIFHYKSANSSYYSEQQKDQPKNWIEILNEMKKKLKKPEICTQKFKSFSQNRVEINTNKESSTKNKQNKPQILHSIASFSEQASSGLLNIQQKLLSNLTNKTRITSQNFKFHTHHEPPPEIKKTVDINKLKKKVLDLKNQRRLFQQRCKDRKTFIQGLKQA